MSEHQAKKSESAMYALLRARLCTNGGNGPSAVVVRSVRSAAGFDARRTIDAVSLGLWPSRGMLLDGYEIKVSRSDWLRELKNPAKAEEFAGLVDRLWLVAADSSIVKDGELPERWGLLVRRGKALVQKVAAHKLHDKGLPPRFSRSFLVPLLRAANEIPPEEMKRLREDAEREAGSHARHRADELARLKEQVAAFEEASEIKLTDYSFGTPEEARRRGEAFKVALAGSEEIKGLRREASFIARAAERLVERAKEIADTRPDEGPRP